MLRQVGVSFDSNYFLFVSMRRFYIAYVQVYVLKAILYFLTQMHAVGVHGFRENSGLVDMIP